MNGLPAADPWAPSHGALLFPPGTEPAQVAAWAEAGLAAAGYVGREAVPPAGYAAHDGEVIRTAVAGLSGSPADRAVALVAQGLPDLFRLARALAAAAPEARFILARRFMGCPASLTVYAAGGPVWRQGTDEDPELPWPVPTEPPHEAWHPASAGLPEALEDAARWLEHKVPSFATVSSASRRWVLRDSPLAPR